jgi:hypothetical protein
MYITVFTRTLSIDVKMRSKQQVSIPSCFLLQTKIRHKSKSTYWGGFEVNLYAWLTSALDGGKCSASRFSRFIPSVISQSTQWMAV